MAALPAVAAYDKLEARGSGEPRLFDNSLEHWHSPATPEGRHRLNAICGPVSFFTGD